MAARDDLLKAFHILPEDLEANRAGALGKRQSQRLMASGYWDLVSAAIIGLALLAILLFIAQKPLKPVQWILSTALFLIALAVGIHFFRKVRAAVVEGKVECLAGTVETQSQGQSGWHLTVAGRSFRMPVRPWHITSGRAYRVYFSPRAGLIVAMEPDGWE